jgi:hypothetical protein
MSVDFLLFDVDQGQAAALRLPSGRWCLFDLGASATCSPWTWVLAQLNSGAQSNARLRGIVEPNDRLYWVTVSHLHGDHLADTDRLSSLPPYFLSTPELEDEYVGDAIASSSESGRALVGRFVRWHQTTVRPGPRQPFFDGVEVRELGLQPAEARAIGGSANSRVNNASIVTRINHACRSVLICGDMELAGWDHALTQQDWRSHVSNVDVLVAPHHGHSSGYSQTLLDLARPRIVLVSAASYDPSVDSRYSSTNIPGIGGGSRQRHSLTTRLDGHIRVSIGVALGQAQDIQIRTSGGINAPLLPSATQAVMEAVMDLYLKRSR